MTSAASWARWAAKSRASVHDSRVPLWRSTWRIDSPASVDPGSRTSTTRAPVASMASATRFATVDLPAPSIPSKAIYPPLLPGPSSAGPVPVNAAIRYRPMSGACP